MVRCVTVPQIRDNSKGTWHKASRHVQIFTILLWTSPFIRCSIALVSRLCLTKLYRSGDLESDASRQLILALTETRLVSQDVRNVLSHCLVWPGLVFSSSVFLRVPASRYLRPPLAPPETAVSKQLRIIDKSDNASLCSNHSKFLISSSSQCLPFSAQVTDVMKSHLPNPGISTIAVT